MFEVDSSAGMAVEDFAEASDLTRQSLQIGCLLARTGGSIRTSYMDGLGDSIQLRVPFPVSVKDAPELKGLTSIGWGLIVETTQIVCPSD